ncbi:MAG TPA: divergent polysaccharide deacetylase family protein [Deltaproteobacteria bacterium]|nr:divergent polysaccharide deacetylase family protein [Deltaproteobacteria bacterium]
MKKSQRSAFIVIIVVLALSVTVAFLIDRHWKSPADTPVYVQAVLPEKLLIEGCLFDLGISREDTRITGTTVRVYVKDELSDKKIRSSFSSLAGLAGVEVVDTNHTRIVFRESTWDIFFQKAMKRSARIAIIVDDLGLSMEPARKIGAIEADLTFSILPQRPHSTNVANYLHGQRKEIILHLPMQGNGKDPGAGALYADMSRDEIVAVVKEDLRSVPYISGVNNHMGSVVTADNGIMRLVFTELKRDGLFFIDSLTTNKSVCRRAAQDIGLPFNARDVFLDNEKSGEYIRCQIEKLISIAMKHSEAIGICHPYPETIAALKKEIPRIKELGIEIVPVSTLVNSP